MATNANTPDSAPPAQEETRWESRRFAAWSLRAGIIIAPVIAAVVVMAIVSRVVPRPRSGSLALVAGWWVLVLASSVIALWVADRAARRLTPLAALLDLAVLFPGRAPTRFAVARKAGDLRSLKSLSEKGSPRERGDVATAAEQILALVGSLRAHDRHTRGHSERVRVYTDMIAAELHLPAAGVDRLRWAALLHDIGKLWIPATVLNKPGKLSKSEWDAIRLHPAYGAELAADLLPWLGPWGLAIVEHHEHYDGSGYPAGLNGTHISLAGRIVAVADSFETSDRSAALQASANARSRTRGAGAFQRPAVRPGRRAGAARGVCSQARVGDGACVVVNRVAVHRIRSITDRCRHCRPGCERGCRRCSGKRRWCRGRRSTDQPSTDPAAGRALSNTGSRGRIAVGCSCASGQLPRRRWRQCDPECRNTDHSGAALAHNREPHTEAVAR